MGKFRQIVSAVNLCLIVALLLPGVGVGPALAQTCGFSVSQQACQRGCQHCEAKRGDEFDTCSCRSRRASTCHVGCQGACCARRGSPPTKTTDTERSASIGVCLCGHGSQPAPAPKPHRTERERVLAVAAAVVAVVIDPPAETALTRWSAQGSSLFTPLDAQRRLCIWRI